MTSVQITVLDLDGVPEDALREGLTPGDVATAAHVRNERRRRRLLAARREFRAAAAALAGCPPEAATLRRGLDGRPLTVAPDRHVAAAEQGRYCVVATAHGLPAGVDLKHVVHAPPAPALVGFLPESARAALADGPADQAPREFALWWCRIEAAARVCGAGLDDGARCLASCAHHAEVVGPGLAVAVAVPDRAPLRVRVSFTPSLAGALP
ncbi:4'-phosphopantetheinyl transferase family protein [Pseudonocardia sp. DLS-67]